MENTSRAKAGDRAGLFTGRLSTSCERMVGLSNDAAVALGPASRGPATPGSFDAKAGLAQPCSASAFRLFSPSSKSLPTILSMLMSTPISLDR